MSEGARLTIWMIIVILDIYIFIDYLWHKAGREARYVKSRKSRKKSRKATRYRRCSYYDDLIRGDMGSMYGDYH